MFIDFKEGGREGLARETERQGRGERCERETSISYLHAHSNRDQTCNRGMCLDWEWTPNLSVYGTTLQPIHLTRADVWPGACFLLGFLCFYNLHKCLLSILSLFLWILYVGGRVSLSFFCMFLSNLPNNIHWSSCLDSILCSCLLCQILIDHKDN